MVAVDDVYLECGENELIALLGHNGAGKTTLISVLTGVLTPSSGSAKIFGLDLAAEPEEIRKIMGYCP